MRPSLTIARPLKIQGFMTPGELVHNQLRDFDFTLRLEDGQGVFDQLMEMTNAYYEQNIRVEAVLLGAIDYFSLREFAADRCFYKGPASDFEINGVKILMDPRRDRSEFVPIFIESEAIKVLSDRK